MKYILATNLGEPLVQVVWVITVITFTVGFELHFRQPTCESDWLQVVTSTTVEFEIHLRIDNGDYGVMSLRITFLLISR